jgi:hypothetical protein
MDLATTLAAIGNGFVPTVDQFLDLPATARQDYAQHDPMALFPEPSSTVPNATLTQQRVLEGILAPCLLGSDPETDAPPYQRPPEPSVPWSDIMKFSPVGTAEQVDLSDPRVESEMDPPPLPRPLEQTQESSVSQRSRRGSSERPKGSPLRHEISPDIIDPRDLMLPPRPLLLSQDLELPPTASPHFPPPTPENKGSSQQHANRSSAVSVSEDELVAIGMPTEQYKPRPSRSRSLKISHEEPVDYSVRPEKAAKMSKRRKTTNTVAATRSSSAIDSLSTPQKVRQICDMGFTPISTGRALKENNGDVTQTVEWLITNGLGEDELAQENTPKRRPTPKAVVADHSTVFEQPQEMQTLAVHKIAASEAPEVANDTTPQEKVLNHTSIDSDRPTSPRQEQTKSPKVQVVIPSKSPKAKSSNQAADPPNTTSKKAKRRKTTLDVPEPAPFHDGSFVAEVIPEKKKRGRPKKTDTAATPSEIAQQVPPETPSTRQDAEMNEHLKVAELNTANTPISISPEIQKTGNIPGKSAATSKPDAEAPVAVSRALEQTTKSSSHSPAGRGKVLYRVGLSKRARIAPLLRTLKK